MVEVYHNGPASRFELTEGGKQSVAEYRMDGDAMVFTHTWVPPEWRGRGIAARLIHAALEFARREGKKVVPQCSYVESYMKRHPEYADLR